MSLLYKRNKKTHGSFLLMDDRRNTHELSRQSNSSFWKRVIAWQRSRAASGYGIIWGDADRNKESSAEYHNVDWF